MDVDVGGSIELRGTDADGSGRLTDRRGRAEGPDEAKGIVGDGERWQCGEGITHCTVTTHPSLGWLGGTHTAWFNLK